MKLEKIQTKLKKSNKIGNDIKNKIQMKLKKSNKIHHTKIENEIQPDYIRS
jgi:hypothetical protein